MSQPRPKGKPTPPPSSPLPGILSAVVVLLVLGLIAGLLISRSGDQSAAAPTESPAAPTLPPVEAPTVAAEPTSPPAAPVAGVLPTATTYNFDAAPPMSIDPAKKYTATIKTPRGDIVVELLPDIAPQTVNSFVFLARQNFYNGLTWHRVIAGFMAQGGDPTGTGTGGPGYTVPAEFTDKILYDQPGIVAMARASDPNSAGSQFFITTAPADFLNSQYTIFGRVIEGQAIVDGIPLRDPDSATTPGETILGITISEQ
ncbi:MAG: peptidylprolyl isomerase [Chloroflexales bacterium]|nr:peptidylprolyl isomerase [Chloroflexales bacterium]